MAAKKGRSAAAHDMEVLRIVRRRDDFLVEINGVGLAGPLSLVACRSVQRIVDLAGLDPSGKKRANCTAYALQHVLREAE
jgi:hypothetical protein